MCVGGDDHISTDICERGQTAFFDGFENGTSVGWSVSTAMKGTWGVSTVYKHGGQFGSRLLLDARLFEGLPCAARVGVPPCSLLHHSTFACVVWMQVALSS